MKNRSLSLMFVMSIALSGITPALNAAQPAMAQTNPSGWAAAKKWWRGETLTPQEQRAFNQLRNRVTIGAIIAALATIAGGVAHTKYTEREKERKLERQKNQIFSNLTILLNNYNHNQNQIDSALKN